jgi:hypothetical protein
MMHICENFHWKTQIKTLPNPTLTMNIIDGIQKLITEHGSAAIISERLALAKDQFSALGRKVEELQRENGKLEAKLEREQVDRDKAQRELNQLQKEHEEEVRVHRSIEFRRGKRTGGNWMAFCPKCHMPAAQLSGAIYVTCSDSGCKWNVRLGADKVFALSQAIAEL